jgi:hypothetical protein
MIGIIGFELEKNPSSSFPGMEFLLDKHTPIMRLSADWTGNASYPSFNPMIVRYFLFALEIFLLNSAGYLSLLGVS